MNVPSVFKTVCERNHWTCLGDRAEIPLSGGRKQILHVQLFDREGEQMVRLYTTVGSADALSPTRAIAALRLNFNLPHGALAVSEGHLVVVDTFLLRDADPAEVEASIRQLCEIGDRYERLIYGTDEH